MSQSNENAVTRPTERTRPRVRPPVDIFENSAGFLLRADLPGVAQEDISLSLEDGQLTLTGQRGDPPAEWKPLGGAVEPYDFRLTLRVPQDIDGQQVSAHLNDGVLEITLPRSEATRARQIQVNAR